MLEWFGGKKFFHRHLNERLSYRISFCITYFFKKIIFGKAG